MKFGIGTVTRGIYLSGDNYIAIAQAAEKAGFDYVAVTDHLILPSTLQSKYPYVKGGAFNWGDGGTTMDQLTTLAFLAAATRRMKLLTSVMVVPHRPVMLTAKMLATLDVLSHGRLILGIGAGWLKEEVELLEAVAFEDRGAYTDEALEAFVELWTKESPRYAGRHVNFKDVLFQPKPVQKPHPPFWIGGESGPALRRAIRHAAAWYPGNNSQTQPLDTPDRLAKGIQATRAACEKAGRDPATLGISLLVQDYFEWGTYKIGDGTGRRLFTGTSDDMLADAAALDKIGVGHATLRLGGASVSEAIERIERFGREVIAKA